MGNEERNFNYYRKNNRFWDLFKDSGKYKDLWNSKEAGASGILTVLLTTIIILLLMSYNLSVSDDVENLFANIRPLLLTFIGGFLSVLGFTIGGLALITGTISENVLRNIEEKKKEKSLMNIIFIFYFSGFLNGLNIFLLSSVYLFTLFNYPAKFLLFIGISVPIIYILFFSIIYSIMLLGTCIRIFLLRDYYKENKN